MLKINIKNKLSGNLKIILVYTLPIIISLIAIFKLNTIVNLGSSFDTNICKNIIKYTIPYMSPEEYSPDSNYDNSIVTFFKDRLFNPVSIIKCEVPVFNQATNQDTSKEESEEGHSRINSFTLNDSSITKVNPDVTKEVQDSTASKAFNPKLVKNLNEGNPEVLIYHSHTMEAYGCNDSTNFGISVVGVGDTLVDELKKYGISAINDKSITTSYDESYERSADRVKNYLKKYGDFKIIIDLHRDSVDDKNTITTTLNNEKMAKIMFVTANNNPHAKDNQNLMNKLNDLSMKLFPGFCRGVDGYRNGKNNAFNQNLSKNSILIEVGSQVNSPQEANTSAKYIARLLAEVINGGK